MGGHTVNLKQLKCVRAIVENNYSVSQASKKLHICQPGVSAHIRNFEAYLGLNIFVRNGKRIIKLTDMGRQIYSRSCLALDQVEKIQELKGGEQWHHLDTRD